MPTFEQGFADAENATDSVLATLGEVSKLARQLRKEARDGNIAGVRRSAERLQDGLNLIMQEVANALDAWPFTPEEEQRYLRDQYHGELIEEARKKNLQIFYKDGNLVAHPSIIRVMPVDRKVQINRTATLKIRPTKITRDLEALQKRTHRNPQTFLEDLYRAYVRLTSVRQSNAMEFGAAGEVVQLRRIYDDIALYTKLSGAKLEYTLLDFAQDLYSLEASDIRQTKAGARVSFPASTRLTETIPFVGPNGETVIYYGIQFTGGS